MSPPDEGIALSIFDYSRPSYQAWIFLNKSEANADMSPAQRKRDEGFGPCAFVTSC